MFSDIFCTIFATSSTYCYILSFKLPKCYDYKNQHYKITNSTTIATDPNTGNLKVYPVWKPTLLGKIVGTILFFGHPLSFLSYDYLIKHFTIFATCF